MAGAGYKLFATGDVLTAAQVNTYLMQQTVMVFASATARNTALSGVLAEGLCCYLTDTNDFQIYDGSAWVSYGSGDVTGITASAPLTGGGTSGNITVGIQDGTTTQKGAVQLTDSTSSTSTTTASTPNSVKSAYDLANGAIPKTLTTTVGDLIYASSANTPARLGIGTTGQVLTVASGVPSWATASSNASFVGCSVYDSGIQTVSNATKTKVNFNSEWFDTSGFHDNSTNNTRITIPTGKGGYYLVTCGLGWKENASGVRILWLLKNNTEIFQQNQNIGTANCRATNGLSVVLSLSAGDYLEIQGYQTSGGNLDLSDNTYDYFSVVYLGA